MGGYELRLFAMTCSLVFFLAGYFPIKPINEDVAAKSSEPPPQWRRRVGQVVFVVIDALRADFVIAPEEDLSGLSSSNRRTLPKIEYLADQLGRAGSAGVVLRASTPTVTLPRIKAMLTGSLPSYLDVVNNINSETLAEDSLLTRWNLAGQQIVMFGDETWGRISPVQFLREDPTSSFFVSDYTEVDVNVTRHLSEELVKYDWDLMILHYLGLDHIGHLQGPYSELVPEKLMEMSRVIEEIHTTLLNKSFKGNLPPAVVVVGDHGMADGGGHGGATLSEVLVPLVVLSPFLQGNEKHRAEYLQVDLTPSLAFLTGVPIPRSSVGRLIPELVSSLPLEERLQILACNARQLLALVPAGSTASAGRDILDEAMVGPTNQRPGDRLERLYHTGLEAVQQSLVAGSALYDVYLLFAAVLLLLLTPGWRFNTAPNPLHVLLVSSVLGAAHCIVCTCVQSRLCTLSLPAVATLSCLALAVSQNSWAAPSLSPGVSKPALCCVLLHSASLLGSSFIEEEHQTVYFILPSLVCLVCVDCWRQGDYGRVSRGILSLGLHRGLRSVHQTGDKWRHLPDLADVLNQQEFKHVRYCLFVMAMICILLFTEKSWLNSSVNFTLIALIALQKYFASYVYAQAVYFVILVKLVLVRRSYCIFECTTLLCCLLHAEVNVILVSVFLCLISVIQSLMADLDDNTRAVSICYLAKCGFFFLGNSNGLSTINVGAGYMGLTGYNAVVVTILLAVHTYSGPLIVFSYVLNTTVKPTTKDCLVKTTTKDPLVKTTTKGLTTAKDPLVKMYCLTTWLDLLVFMLLCLLLRYHIFVWTVFSPKLLYFGMELVVLNVFFAFFNVYSAFVIDNV